MTCRQTLITFATLLASSGAVTGVLRGQVAMSTPSAPVTELERFIVTESALAQSGDLLPTSRPFYSAFGKQPIVEVPRSVTIVTPEIMTRLGLEDFADLGRIGAGTQQINYYGVPGTPALRGARAGAFFNGIQRAF